MLTLNGYMVKDFRFPDNTFRITSKECHVLEGFTSAIHSLRLQKRIDSAKSRDCFNIFWKYEDPSEQVLVDMLVRHLRDRLFASHIYLTMPYIPNARMDRTKDLSAEVNTLKYFCQWLNEKQFDTVTVLDPHSDVSLTLIDRVLESDIAPWVKSVVEDFEADFIFFPDEGAYKRYGNTYNWRPFFYGNKMRDWKTGKIMGLQIENPMNWGIAQTEGKRILIIDDICSKGGTFAHAATALGEFKFGEIALCVTHLENTVFTGKVLSDDCPITHIYTTDSLAHGSHDKILTTHLELEE